MTLKETINLYCDYGKHVVINNGVWFVIFSPFKDKEHENYRCSTLEHCVSDCSYSISRWDCSDYELSNIEKTGWKFHSIWTPPAPKQFEVGQLVDVLENAKDHAQFNDWNKEAKNMVGQKGLEIKGIDDEGYNVWQKDKKDWWLFEHKYLIPHIPEQTTDILIKNGKKYKVQIIEEIK